MLLKKIIYFILSIQEKILLRRLSNTVGVKNSSLAKKHYFNGCTVDLNNLAEAEKQTGVGHGQISRVCNGKRQSAGGYIWKYEE